MRSGPFTRLLVQAKGVAVGARGNVMTDAFHAALAIENGATWITTGCGFARFPGLRGRPLLDG